MVFATARYNTDMLDTPTPVVNQGKTLTRLRLPAAIHEGPSFVASTLAGEWERD